MKRLAPNISFVHYNKWSYEVDSISPDFDRPFYVFDDVIKLIHHESNVLFGVYNAKEHKATFLDFFSVYKLMNKVKNRL